MRIFDLVPVMCLALFTAACPGDKGDEGGEETEGSGEATDSETGPTTTAEPDTQVTNASQMSETTETSDTSETDGPPTACTCGSDEPCDEQLCDQVRYVDEDGDGELDADAVDAYLAASACALEALRDGVAGRIAWESYINGGQFSSHGVLWMFGDRTATQTLGGAEDICYYEVEREVVGPLQSAAFFDKCLTDADTDARFGCIRNAGSGMATVCVEGVTDCSGV